MKKLKSLYVTGIVKDSKNNMEKYLFGENERLNAIIDELEEINEKQLTEIFMLNLKIKQIKELLEEFDYKRNSQEDLLEFISYIVFQLGDKENE